MTGEPPFTVTLARRTLRPGDALSGSVLLCPSQDLHIKSLLVDFQRVRVDSDGKQTNRSIAHASGTKLADDLSVPAGAGKEFPFELRLPADATPGQRAPHTTLSWMVVASAVGGRFKAAQSVSTQIHVHNDPDGVAE